MLCYSEENQILRSWKSGVLISSLAMYNPPDFAQGHVSASASLLRRGLPSPVLLWREKSRHRASGVGVWGLTATDSLVFFCHRHLHPWDNYPSHVFWPILRELCLNSRNWGIQGIVIQVDRTGSGVAGPNPPIRRMAHLLFETESCGHSCRGIEAARAHALWELPFDLSDCLHCLSHETIDPIKCIFRSRPLIHLGKNKKEAPLGWWRAGMPLRGGRVGGGSLLWPSQLQEPPMQMNWLRAVPPPALGYKL